jgi:para-nitrobenzyl esterase
MVTFNYRVGFEGFGAVPGFPHNRGLLDQVAALDWVQHNIAGFGGDPDNVTVVGQSAGAGSIVALAIMPQATGLFRRGIAQSVPGVFYSPELATEVTDHIARAAEVDGGSGASGSVLARLAPERLVAASQAITFSLRSRPEQWGFLGYANTPFAPVVDGDVLPASPFDAMEDGAAGHLDLVVGFTRDEYQSFLFDAGALRRFSERDVRRAVATFGLPASAIDEYRSAHPDIDGSALYSMACADALFRVPSMRTAASHAAASNGGRTYLYEFAWPSPLAGGVLGACHAIDVPVVFGTFDSPFAQAWIGPDPGPGAVDLSRRMRRAWVEFVSTGDPGWPAYRPGEALAQVWGFTDTVVADPEGASRRIWRDHRFGAVPALGSAAEERSTAQT